jgi:hypothetical protein
MLHTPNPALNEKEQELMASAPEECLSHAVQRSALALDETESSLPPRVLAVVRSVATGERLTLPAQGSSSERAVPSALPPAQEHEWALTTLSEFPQIAHLLSEKIISPDEAMQAANTIDNILGRYLTGTRYAAP